MNRNEYIGSTEIVALVEPDASPFTSAYKMWCEKTGLIEREDNPSERMKTGKFLEEAILAEWNKRNNYAFVFNNEPHFYKEGIGATPDGICAATNEGAEVKTVTPFMMSHWDNGTPRYIWWQAQHEMLCTGLSRIAVIAQFGFERLSHEWIEADPIAHQAIIDECDAFWARCRGELPPPSVDGHKATTEALARRKHDARVIELDAAARDLTDRLSNVERYAKDTAKEAQELKNQIRAALGDASTGVFPDGTGWRINTVNRKESVVKASSYTTMKRIKAKDTVEQWDGETE